MPDLQAGDQIDYTVTWLEMTGRPTEPMPDLPAGQNVALLAAKSPPPDYFLYLYRTVGAEYEWTDWLERSPEDVAAFIGDPKVVLHTMLLDGWPGGFFILDERQPAVVDLAYFGLMPQAIGRGLGRWLLATAVAMAWDRPGAEGAAERVTVNTCSLDHPQALGLYQKIGFRPIRREQFRRRLSRARIATE